MDSWDDVNQVIHAKEDVNFDITMLHINKKLILLVKDNVRRTHLNSRELLAMIPTLFTLWCDTTEPDRRAVI